MLPPCRDVPTPRGARRPRDTPHSGPPGHPPALTDPRNTPRAPPRAHTPGMSPPDTALREEPRGDPGRRGGGGGGGGRRCGGTLKGALHAGGRGGIPRRSLQPPLSPVPRDIFKPCSLLLPGALPALPAPGLERGRGWGDATPPIAACRPRPAPGAQGEPGTGLLPGSRRSPPAVTRGHAPGTPLPAPHRPPGPPSPV